LRDFTLFQGQVLFQMLICFPRSQVFTHTHTHTYTRTHTNIHYTHLAAQNKNFCLFQCHSDPPAVPSGDHTHRGQDWLNIRVYSFTCTYIYMYIYLYLHTYTHTYTFTYVRTHVYVHRAKLVVKSTAAQWKLLYASPGTVCDGIWLRLCVCKCDGVCAFVCFCVRHVFEGLCVRVREKMAHKVFVCSVFVFNFSLWAKIRLSCIGLEDSVVDRIAVSSCGHCRWLSPKPTLVVEWNEIWDLYYEHAASILLCCSVFKHVNPLDHNGIRIVNMLSGSCVTKGWDAKERVPSYSSYLVHAHRHIQAKIHTRTHRYLLAARLLLHRVVLLQVSPSFSPTSFREVYKL